LAFTATIVHPFALRDRVVCQDEIDDELAPDGYNGPWTASPSTITRLPRRSPGLELLATPLMSSVVLHQIGPGTSGNWSAIDSVSAKEIPNVATADRTANAPGGTVTFCRERANALSIPEMLSVATYVQLNDMRLVSLRTGTC
jgi:hypothetical protein